VCIANNRSICELEYATNYYRIHVIGYANHACNLIPLRLVNTWQLLHFNALNDDEEGGNIYKAMDMIKVERHFAKCL